MTDFCSREPSPVGDQRPAWPGKGCPLVCLPLCLGPPARPAPPQMGPFDSLGFLQVHVLLGRLPHGHLLQATWRSRRGRPLLQRQRTHLYNGHRLSALHESTQGRRSSFRNEPSPAGAGRLLPCLAPWVRTEGFPQLPTWRWALCPGGRSGGCFLSLWRVLYPGPAFGVRPKPSHLLASSSCLAFRCPPPGPRPPPPLPLPGPAVFRSPDPSLPSPGDQHMALLSR